jgi:phthiocerol/phenolphthiocerol synthesis type-I polyketide synthase E
MPRREQLASGSDLPSVASQLVSVVRQQQPSGPYYLGGWCADGLLAFEMAQQLTAAGERVALLVLFDTPNPALLRRRSLRVTVKRLLVMLRWRVRFQLASVRQLAMKEVPAHVGERMVALFGYAVGGLRALLHPDPRAKDALFGVHHPSGIRLRIRNYEHQTYPGPLTLFRAAGRPTDSVEDPSYGWDGTAWDGLVVHTVPGDHLTMFLEPNVDVLARKLAAELDRVDGAVALFHNVTEHTIASEESFGDSSGTSACRTRTS